MIYDPKSCNGLGFFDESVTYETLEIIKKMKINCWEFKDCGREPNGLKAGDLGVCPASTEERLDGIHGGRNAGRSCWVVAGSFCNGKIQGTYAAKIENCRDCDFFLKVDEDEGMDIVLPINLLGKIKS
jgi:hypothetical protein